MSNFYRLATIMAGCALSISCSAILVPHTTPSSVVLQPLAASPVAQTNSLKEGINQATHAAVLAQSAKSAQDWDQVAQSWIQAISSLQAISPISPERVYAQKKVAEYMVFLEVAQQRAASTSLPPSYPTFNNQLLDDQLVLYLSYVAAIGPPDVLIVGSSRSLQGVDPRQLQQALATKGVPGLRIFNFGVNGATAQVVNFLLQRLLTEDQLPQLIIWADGVRAFNSGRVDRTYNLIVASPGYKHLLSGNRPTSSLGVPVRPIVPKTTGSPHPETEPLNSTLISDRKVNETQRDESRIITWSPSSTQLSSELPSPPSSLAMLTPNYSIAAIDANGFLPVDIRFNPAVYYQQKPRVSGRYDADYGSFQLVGQQTAALDNLVAFTTQNQIPLVFVNLPLSQDYLDAVRQRYEQQFRLHMQRRASEKGFIFLDLFRRVNQNDYYADPSHLNRYGAAAVAHQIAADPRISWPDQ